jgi:hypothetical protein
MATDANGFPIHFEITGGEVHDCKIAPEMIEQLPSAEHTIVHKGYDSEEIRFEKNYPIPLYLERKTLKWGMLISIGAFTNIDTWLRIYLQE